jgi:enoyl-[acyl-carrier-protein] reductase (NADH)
MIHPLQRSEATEIEKGALMIIEIDIKEDARIVGTTQQVAAGEETIEAIAHMAASALKIDVEELLVDLRVDGSVLAWSDNLLATSTSNADCRRR